MVKDDRDLLELLKDELAFVEQGGYGRSVRTPWRERSAFQDSLTCINYADPDRAHPCNECHLIEFVSEDDRKDSIPCHHIPLNREGDTIVELENHENQHKLEENLKEWLRTKIKELEEKSPEYSPEAKSVAAEPETLHCCKT